MVLSGFWWFLKVFGDSGSFLVVLGGSWWFIVVLYGSSWFFFVCFFGVCGAILGFLKSLVDFYRFFVVLCGFCCVS